MSSSTSRPTSSGALQLFAFALRDGGYLALGKAETPHQLVTYFTPLHAALKLYQRSGGRLAVPPLRLGKDAVAPLPRISAGWHAGALAAHALSGTRSSTTPEKVGALMLGLSAGVVVVDRHYDIQAVNDAAQRLLGITRAAPGQDLIHLVAHPPSATLRAAIDAALHNEVIEADLTLNTALGAGRYLHLTAYPYSLAATPTAAEQVLLLITEVTTPRAVAPAEPSVGTIDDAERHQQERDRQQGAQIAQLAENNRDLVAANQELVRANLGLTNINEELLVRNEELQTATEEIKTLNEELQATNEELETMGEEQEATVEELRMTNDDLQVRSAEVLHLAALRAAQHQASMSKAAEFAAILLGMGDALLVLDRAGKTRFTNPAYVDLFGDEFAVFIAEDDAGVPLPPEETPQHRAIQGGPFRMTFTLPTPAGGRRWLEASGEPIMVDHVQEGGIITFRDISDRSLRRLQDEFLALASHELRVPLTVIYGMAQWLQRKIPDEHDPAFEPTQIIIRQVRHQQRIIDDLTDMERLQHGKLHLQLSPVDLRIVAQQAVGAVEINGSTPPIVVAAPDEPLLIAGDAVRLEQIITNLLTNARKYAPTSAQIRLRLRRQGQEAEMQVADTGPGIAPDALPHLFQRFYQATPETRMGQQGLGLGLFLVNELVMAHQGRIAVHSVVGEGTTFTIHFPLFVDSVIPIADGHLA